MKFYSNGFSLFNMASKAKLEVAANAEASKTGLTGTAGSERFTVSAQSLAQLAIGSVDTLLQTLDEQRAHLGAMQNRMESSIRNQSNVSMNVSDARARIRDTDFAEESAKLSQQTIIQQAASSMLTQANSRPQLALSLLR